MKKYIALSLIISLLPLSAWSYGFETYAFTGDENGNKVIDIGEKVGDIRLWGSTKKRHKLKDHRGKVVVIHWYNPSCDASMAMFAEGGLQELQQLFIIRDDVIWVTIVSAPKDGEDYHTQEELWHDTKDWQAYPNAVLLDWDVKVAPLLGVEHFPAFVVLNKDHEMIYRGPYESADGQEQYLVSAIEDALANQVPDVPERKIEPWCKVPLKNVPSEEPQ